MIAGRPPDDRLSEEETDFLERTARGYAPPGGAFWSAQERMLIDAIKLKLGARNLMQAVACYLRHRGTKP